MSQELIYLEDKDILVTSSVIKTGSFTFPLRNIASYRTVYGGGSIFTYIPFILGLVVLGLYVPMNDETGIGCGIALIVFGIIMLFSIKTLYLITSAEQVRAYTTHSQARMARLINAIDQALADYR